MSEQQRVVIAVILCAGIFLVWQVFFTPKPTEPAPGAAPTAPSAPAPGAPAPTAPPSAGAPAAAPAVVPESRTLETTDIVATVSTPPPHLSRLELKGYYEQVGEDGVRAPVSLVIVRGGAPQQAGVSFRVDGAEAPPLRFTDSDRGVRLEGATASGVELELQIAPGQQPFTLDYRLIARNRSSAPAAVESELALHGEQTEEGSFFSPPLSVSTGSCLVDGSVERQSLSDLEDGPYAAAAPATWVALDRQYFVVALVPSTPAACRMSASGKSLTVSALFPKESIPAGASLERSFVMYAGPKRDDTLAPVATTLPELIDYTVLGIPLGFLSRPMLFIMSRFHGWTGSWGMAIMLLTLLVKIVTLPITYKSQMSMRRMQLLKPELDKLKEKYANDRERQQVEQFKLFKEKGVSPLGGCLPMLLQMPIWFALYRGLASSVDLYQEPFLWLPDLTAKEPGIPFLAIVLGVVTFLQQHFTPMSPGADNQQARMMKIIMPPMFTLIMISLPAGLVLYILVNSLLSIVQQVAINKRMT